jgi:nitrogen fixation protein FixH
VQKSEKKEEINYWPYAIVGMILTVVLLGIWTIKVAVSNPVQLDNSYMMTYQDVDENINEILAKQQAFDARYSVDLSRNVLKVGRNRIEIVVRSNAGAPVENAGIVAVVTRPTTTKEDIELKTFEHKGALYVSEPFELKRGGRWNIQVRVTIGDDVGFKTRKTFVKE